MPISISFVFPVFNEELRIFNLPQVTTFFRNNISCEFEILVICNGCTDQTYLEALRYAGEFSEIRCINTPFRGRGHALKLGFMESIGEIIGVCAIDRAWDESFYPTL